MKITAIVAAGVLLAATCGVVNAADCNRACLNGMVDSYLAALVAHDPSKVKIAPDAKFVENAALAKVGEGFWTPGLGTMGVVGCAAQLDTKTMSYIKRIDNRRVDIADPERGWCSACRTSGIRWSRSTWTSSACRT